MEMNEFTFIPKSILQSSEGTTAKLRERAGFLSNNLKHTRQFDGLRKRMQAQQYVLFNLIAQQDAALNPELARDSKNLSAASKRNGSAMKIIAILTTIFLPGNFISAFFTMPLFDWGTSATEQVMTNHLDLLRDHRSLDHYGDRHSFCICHPRESRMNKAAVEQAKSDMDSLLAKWRR